MQIHGATALVTGANRGLGRHLARLLRDRGADVYAAARNPATIDLEGVRPIALDLTDPVSVEAAAAEAHGVSILVNNAGVATGASMLTGNLADIRSEFETNFFGTLAVSRAFAPQLGDHPESYLLNILSVVSWVNVPGLSSYSASKSAEWSLTNELRRELAPQGTRVAGLHVGLMDTDMAASLDRPKHDAADIARIAVDAIEAGETEIVADEMSKKVLAALSGGVAALYPDVA